MVLGHFISSDVWRLMLRMDVSFTAARTPGPGLLSFLNLWSSVYNCPLLNEIYAGDDAYYYIISSSSAWSPIFIWCSGYYRHVVTGLDGTIQN
uniref:Uncharacterized protein n=1 Tax=Anguilla anguilla TaxID=7936 RepID=A0A0E9R5H3_ANGAN